MGYRGENHQAGWNDNLAGYTKISEIVGIDVMSNKWHQYEQAKREWASANPRATPEEYDRACRAIAKRLGV